jgi:16S rRNA (uracil1498-N3)-methyltransferase
MDEPSSAGESRRLRILLAQAPLRLGPLRLTDDEAHHGRAVLRLAAGEAVALTDGAGRLAVATVTAVDRRALELRVDSVTEVPPPAAARLTLAVAPPKGGRLDDLVHGLAELGVGTLAPLACARGVREPATTRLERLAGEALKQCRGAHRLHIAAVTDIPALVAGGGELILADPQGAPADAGLPRNLTIVVGPEGGLTVDERDRLVAGGARRVRLAGQVLRIETAALAAAAVWAAAWERHV